MGFDLYMIREPKYQDAPGYWRGLGYVREIMEVAGVLDSESDYLPFEHEPPAGVDEALVEEILEHLRDGTELESTPTVAQMQACREYHAQYEIWQQSRSPLPGKVPAYKYAANDGFHVVPEECALIADALDRLLADPPEDFEDCVDWEGGRDSLIELIEDWRDYNRVAASHGGYKVC